MVNSALRTDRRLYANGRETAFEEVSAGSIPTSRVEDCCLADTRQHLFQGRGIVVVRFLFDYYRVAAPLAANQCKHVQDSG